MRMEQPAAEPLCQYTDQEYLNQTEPEIKAGFLRCVKKCPLFSWQFEVYGKVDEVLQGEASAAVTQTSNVRIDCILHPTFPLLEMGWSLGCVGVEFKAANKKIGRPISQAMDYARGRFNCGGMVVALSWVFLWPLTNVAGDVASIMAQNRVGNGYASRGDGSLRLYAGGRAVLHKDHTGGWCIADAVSGKKTGSR